MSLETETDEAVAVLDTSPDALISVAMEEDAAPAATAAVSGDVEDDAEPVGAAALAAGAGRASRSCSAAWTCSGTSSTNRRQEKQIRSSPASPPIALGFM